MAETLNEASYLRQWLESRRKIEQVHLDERPWRNDMSTPLRRLRAYLDMALVDHGILRHYWTSLQQISPKMWRSNQPGPGRIAKAAEMGVKTIVNLRGRRPSGTYALEAEACRKHGLALMDFSIGSREPPRKVALKAAREMFETIAYPALMHCKSGADRAGFMSVFYLFTHEGVSLAQAQKHLSLRYGHVRQGKTGVLDYFWDNFAARQAETGIGFWDWVEREYDPETMKSAFMSQWWANILVDRILNRE